jgi:uncharacterized protein (DUF427 family)
MARAMWNGVVLAETDRPVLLEGNVYFPPEDVRREYLARTRAWSVCPWKGLARYSTVRAGGQVNKNAAWYYPHPSPLARKIKNHVAFWNGFRWTPGRWHRPGQGRALGTRPRQALGRRADPCLRATA